MIVKKLLLALLLTSSVVWAQVPPSPGAAGQTNRDEALRQALRRSIEGGTNSTTIVPLAETPTNSPALPPAVGGTVVVPAPPTIITPPVAPLPTPAVPAPSPTAATADRIAVPSNATNVVPTNRIAVPSNPSGPAVPGAPALLNPPTVGATALSTNASSEEVLPAGAINFAAVDINEVMKIYAEYVQRTILRPTTLPGIITLKTQTPLTKREAIQALDAVLALNGVSVIP